MYDFEHIQIAWVGSWSETIREVESVLSSYETTARNTTGFVSWRRSAPITFSAYERVGESDTCPYCLINYVVVRPLGTTKLHQYYVEVTGLPTTTALSRGKRNDAKSD